MVNLKKKCILIFTDFPSRGNKSRYNCIIGYNNNNNNNNRI